MTRQRTDEDLAIDATVLIVMVLVSLPIVYPFWKMLVDSFSTPAAASCWTATRRWSCTWRSCST